MSLTVNARASLNQEKKLVAEIKRLAEQNQLGAVKVMAKDLVRTRRSITKFYGLKTQLQAVSLRMQTLKTTAGHGRCNAVGSREL